MWNPRGLQLPPGLAAAAVAELKCVGSRLPFVGGGVAADDLDQDPAGTSFGSAAAPEPAARHLHAFLAKLEHLREHGLRLQDELVLLRTFVNGAALHHARAHLLDEAWARAYDDRVLEHAQGALGQPLTATAREVAYLPLAGSGLGLHSLEERRLPAFVGSWQACLAEVRRELGEPSLQAFAAACPQTWATAEQAGRLAGASATAWVYAAAERREKAQKRLTQPAQQQRRARLLASLPASEAASLRSAGGKGAGAFLLPPTRQDHLLADEHLQPALALRLRLPLPEGASPTCLRRRSDGTACGCDLRADPGHAVGCPVGGLAIGKHDGVRDWLAGWLAERGAAGVDTEQAVPAWDRARPDGSVEAARLDVTYVDPVAGRQYVDVTVTDAALGAGTGAGRSRATRDGAAAAAAEERKHRRYPGPALLAFALETLGRPGKEAQALLRTWSAGDPQVLAAARQSLSAALQRGNAEAWRTAVLPQGGAARRTPAADPGAPPARRARRA